MATIASRNDFKVERMRGSGPGGQKRNKTDSCIRITHIPTGLSEYCCETKSQHQNLKTAFTRLAVRVVDAIMPQKTHIRFAAAMMSYDPTMNPMIASLILWFPRHFLIQAYRWERRYQRHHRSKTNRP